MFTGIVEKLGSVLSEARSPLGLRIRVQAGFTDLELGESVAVNGVCLTVAELSSREPEFFISAETLDKTSLGSLRTGSLVNLERALKLSSRLSGHWVQGHVDGLARLRSVEPVGESFRLEVELPVTLAKYCVEKGSIALDGISLTINRLRDEPGSGVVELMIIPHTWNQTCLSRAKPSDLLNVEVDVLAKYVERILECQSSTKQSNS